VFDETIGLEQWMCFFLIQFRARYAFWILRRMWVRFRVPQVDDQQFEQTLPCEGAIFRPHALYNLFVWFLQYGGYPHATARDEVLCWAFFWLDMVFGVSTSEDSSKFSWRVWEEFSHFVLWVYLKQRKHGPKCVCTQSLHINISDVWICKCTN
jgi:hypothetical protein